MRTRLVRPEFWSDSRMADLPDGARLTYIGLWCLADDDGYLRWSLRDIAAELYRYETPRKREVRVGGQLNQLIALERVTVLDCTTHALIPSIPKYRIKGGNHSVQYHDAHTSTCLVPTSMDKYPSGYGSVDGSSTASLSVAGSGLVRPPAKKNGKNIETDEDRLLRYRLLRDDASQPAYIREAAKTEVDRLERWMQTA